jgi:hypothetical protein
MIGLSIRLAGLEEYTTKLDFENYINSFISDYTDDMSGKTTFIQDMIDDFWLIDLWCNYFSILFLLTTMTNGLESNHLEHTISASNGVILIL